MYVAMIVVFVTILLIGVGLLIHQRRQSGHKPNYRLLFVLGLVWLPLGIIQQSVALWGPGLVFFIVGAANRKHWEESRWKDLSPREKRLKLWTIGILLLLIALGVGVYFFVR